MKLPSFEDCIKIVNSGECFRFNKTTIKGRQIYTFGARLAEYKDYKDPLGDGSIDAFEMRGITFVESQNGNFHRFLSLGKFFNLNQVEDTSESAIKDLYVLNCHEKLDGSLISFIEVDGEILPKSKMVLDSDPAILANKIYNSNPSLKDFVRACFDEHLMPIFEVCSPRNRIVIPYEEDSLKLLQIRSNITGEYVMDPEEHYLVKKFNIDCAKSIYGATISELKEKAKTLEGEEGWVVVMSNGLYLKIKTKWYFERHYMLTEDIYKENRIIHYILEETMDDVISMLDINDPIRPRIAELSELLSTHLSKRVSDVKSLIAKGPKDRRKFMAEHKDKMDRHFAVYHLDSLDEPKLEESLIKALLKKTYHLEDARRFCDEELGGFRL